MKKQLLTTPLDLITGETDDASVFSHECFAAEVPIVRETFTSLKLQADRPNDPRLNPFYKSFVDQCSNLFRNDLQRFMNMLYEEHYLGEGLNRFSCDYNCQQRRECGHSRLRLCGRKGSQNAHQEWILHDSTNRWTMAITIFEAVFGAFGDEGIAVLVKAFEKFTGKTVQSTECIQPETFCGLT